VAATAQTFVPGSQNNPAWQSLLSMHGRPSGHNPQRKLPQSGTGSPPLAIPSVHVGGWQQRSTPGGQNSPHTSLVQSDATLQLSPVPQLWSQLPPQSSSASSPFRVSSSQLGGAQTPPGPHTPLEQSASSPQPLPSGHGLEQMSPPQSTSVSSWFRVSSSQLASVQRPWRHRRESQSASTLQPLPASHAFGQTEPQSDPASLPFCIPSEQVAFKRPGCGVHSGPSHSTGAQPGPRQTSGSTSSSPASDGPASGGDGEEGSTSTRTGLKSLAVRLQAATHPPEPSTQMSQRLSTGHEDRNGR
jgi:hypothetical protein